LAGDELMASHRVDPEILAHLEWMGFVRPTGLVVSAPALVRAGAILDRRDAEGQRLLRACVAERVFDPKVGLESYLLSFRQFAESVLGWNFSPKGYAGTAECPIPGILEVTLTDYGETLRPDFAVRELEPKEGAPSWQLLVRVLDLGEEFDRGDRGHGHFEASAHSRMERMLRQTGVAAGLLFNGRALRIVSAPHGESSGWLDFRVTDMVQTAGRPISTAMRLLLSQQRLLSLPRSQRLGALLEDSRKFQNEVSEKLAEQVLHALYELLRGFQAAHDASNGELLRKPLSEHPDEVYRALLTVILRLVFLLFAEEKDMLPDDETFLRYYSLAGLYERLREDAALFPDTMDQRYGAWAQILVLFRMIYDGAESGAMRLPRRHGLLFDPDRFPFLEARISGAGLQPGERIELPLVPDGTIYRALEKLLVLDGERISYRALDVEQIGSVYETMMGFRLETATGRSVAIKADKKQGAPTAVNLEALVTQAADKREKFLQDHADRKISDTVKKAVLAATTLEDLHAALLPVMDLAAAPDLVSEGAMVLQPSEERRRSGSHYTPRELTNPIVRTTLEPILSRLRGEHGRPPRPEQILDLKVCDPAMGSGAFLVETCRQLGDALVEAWHAHDEVPVIPVDEDEVIFARRMIAQRCLHGVDKNPVAVDLAKMSLWLVTLAKNHALTFVDHAMRCGDSLVGLSRKQIAAFHWIPAAQMGLVEERIRKSIDTVNNYRKQILSARDGVPYSLLKQKLDAAEDALGLPRQIGDAIIAAFFVAEKPKDRENTRVILSDQLMSDLKRRGFIEVEGKIDAAIAKLVAGEISIHPFHWEIEFPEVFERDDSGFDAVVGNPPFLGGPVLSQLFGGPAYQEWLKESNSRAFGNADLAAYFFRRAFSMIRSTGTFGLIATNSISEGGTRTTGLQFILAAGGVIYKATRSLSWPGEAAVFVAVVHIAATPLVFTGQVILDDQPVQFINSRLRPNTEFPDPVALKSNDLLAFMGAGLGSSGFILDKAEYLVLAENPKNDECLMPYLNGEIVNSSPTQTHERYSINFGANSFEYATQFPSLLEIVRTRVKPDRDRAKDHGPGKHGKKYWWQFTLRADPLYDTIRRKSRCLVAAINTSHLSFSFQPIRQVFAHTVVVFAFDTYGPFACLQSRIHYLWAQLLSSSLKDDMRYSVRDASHTFPFPERFDTDSRLEIVGNEYYEFRASLMVHNNEGLTATYNRFHDPDERSPAIQELRRLHDSMDRTVLDAYRWDDLAKTARSEFLLEHEIDEEEWGDRKKPWRYRWPDEVRDEVLARLLELNAKRAKEEELSGAAAIKKTAKKALPKRTLKESGTENLFS
jgi:hypothetical protein